VKNNLTLRRWKKSWRGEKWGWGAHPWWPPGPGRPAPAHGDEQHEQGAVGRSWSREKETREEEGSEERGFGGRKKIVVACPYGAARQGRKGRGDVAAREFDAKPRVLLASVTCRYTNICINTLLQNKKTIQRSLKIVKLFRYIL
jgi:hypothetical protein